jgi:O-methyltransferase
MIGEGEVTTLVSAERAKQFMDAIRYVHAANIPPGDIIEIGCWRAGLLAQACELCKELKSVMPVLGFDLFEEMPPPGPEDGEHAKSSWELARNPYEEALALIKNTGYLDCQLIKGDIFETLENNTRYLPISVLRIDVDWYEATLHALKTCYPLLQEGGVLLIDDYGHWEGCRKAVDEYFKDNPQMWFHADYTGVGTIKQR